MSDTYVAVTDVKFGKDDGEVQKFKRGEEVSGLSAQQMLELWSAGSIAAKGSPQDPNTWPDASREVEPTTPRFVEDVLKVQVAFADAPDDVDTPKTQPRRGVFSDPKSLLEPQVDEDSMPTEPTPSNATTSTTGGGPTSVEAVEENQATAAEFEAEENATSDEAGKKGKQV
jgi:hypothetical protein